MPWRLIVFVGIFIVFLVFIGFNLDEEYRCDINFGFVVLEQVPVFYTIFISFALGLLCALPLVFFKKKPRKEVSSMDTKDTKHRVEDLTGESVPGYSGGKYFDKNKFKGSSNDKPDGKK